MKSWITGAAAALIVLAAGTAAANDTVASMQAGGLRFERTEGIAMLSEDLYLSMGEVRVTYRFLNHTAEDINVVVAFPMPDIEAGWVADMGGNLEDPARMLPFLTWADGRPVHMQMQQTAVVGDRDVTEILAAYGVPLNPFGDDTLDALAGLDGAALAALERQGVIDRQGDDPNERWAWPQWTLKTTHYWTQYFPAGQEVEIRHVYVPAVGGTSSTPIGSGGAYAVDEDYDARYCTDAAFEQAAARGRERGLHYTETWLDYVLTTGANWAGPIREFRMVVDKGSVDNLVSFCGTGVQRISPTQFEVRYENYVPERDMNVLFLNGFRMD